MACSRPLPCPECRNGVFYTCGAMNEGRLAFEPCHACKRFGSTKAVAAYLRRFLDWADDLPDEMLPDLPKKGARDGESAEETEDTDK